MPVDLSVIIKYYTALKLGKKGLGSTTISKLIGIHRKTIQSWTVGGAKPHGLQNFSNAIEVKRGVSFLLLKIRRELTEKNIRFFVARELASRGYHGALISRALDADQDITYAWIRRTTGPYGIDPSFHDEELVKESADKIERQMRSNVTREHLEYYLACTLHEDYDLNAPTIASALGVPRPTIVSWIERRIKNPIRVGGPSIASMNIGMWHVRRELTIKDIKYYLAIELHRHGLGDKIISQLLGVSSATIGGWIYRGIRPPSANEKIKVEKIVEEELAKIKRRLTEENLPYILTFELLEQGFSQKRISELINVHPTTINTWVTGGLAPKSYRESLIDDDYARELVLKRLVVIRDSFSAEVRVVEPNVSNMGMGKSILEVNAVTQNDVAIVLSYIPKGGGSPVGATLFVNRFDTELIKNTLRDFKALGAQFEATKIRILTNNDARTGKKRALIDNIIQELQKYEFQIRNFIINEDAPRCFGLRFVIRTGEISTWNWE